MTFVGMSFQAEDLRQLKRKLDRVTEERDILKKRWPTLRRIRNEISIHLDFLSNLVFLVFLAFSLERSDFIKKHRCK